MVIPLDSKSYTPDTKKAYWATPLDFDAICRFAKQVAQVAIPSVQTVKKVRKEMQEYRVPKLGGLISTKAKREIDVQYDESVTLDYWVLGSERFYHCEEQKGRYVDIVHERYKFILKRTGELTVQIRTDEEREDEDGRTISFNKSGVISERVLTASDALLFDWRESRYDTDGTGYREWGNDKIDRSSALLFARQGEGLLYLLEQLPKKNGISLDKTLTSTVKQPSPQNTLKPVAQQHITAKQNSIIPVVSSIAVGNIVSFGQYKWRVLDVRNWCALLVADTVTHVNMAYSDVACTWETSSLRKWLNSEFLTSFTEEEGKRIMRAEVKNESNPWYYADGGNATGDRVFLLSIYEIVKYFGDSEALQFTGRNDVKYYYFDDSGNRRSVTINEARKDASKDYCFSDQYDAARIARYNGKPTCYWLRTPGSKENAAALVDSNGNVDMGGDDVDDVADYIGVRPALWIVDGKIAPSAAKPEQSVESSMPLTGDDIGNMSEDELNDWLNDLLKP
jgi:glucan-binding YG repeat protein